MSVMVQEETGIRPERTSGMTGFAVNIYGKTYINHFIFLASLEVVSLCQFSVVPFSGAIPDELWITHFLCQ